MIFEFKNLGAIKEAQIEMGKLTVISGKNNTGKTYLTYATLGFFGRELHAMSILKFMGKKSLKYLHNELFTQKNEI